MADVYRRSRAHLYPGHAQDFACWTLSESQTTGLPAVVRSLGGVAECIVNGQTGYIVPDAEAFANVAVQILSDDGVFKSLSDAAGAPERRRTWPLAANEMTDFISPTAGRGSLRLCEDSFHHLYANWRRRAVVRCFELSCGPLSRRALHYCVWTVGRFAFRRGAASRPSHRHDQAAIRRSLAFALARGTRRQMGSRDRLAPIAGIVFYSGPKASRAWLHRQHHPPCPIALHSSGYGRAGRSLSLRSAENEEVAVRLIPKDISVLAHSTASGRSGQDMAGRTVRRARATVARYGWAVPGVAGCRLRRARRCRGRGPGHRGSEGIQTNLHARSN